MLMYTSQKTLSPKESLEAHRNIHSGNKPYKCAVCDKTYSDHSNFNAKPLISPGHKIFNYYRWLHRCPVTQDNNYLLQ